MTDLAPVDQARCSLVERLVMELGAQGLHDALTPEERVVLPYVREAWERPSIRLPAVPPRKEPGFGRWSGQQEPPGKWLFWIACGGRGVGKSWLLTQFVLTRPRAQHPGRPRATSWGSLASARLVAGCCVRFTSCTLTAP